MNILQELDEVETDVAHRAARLYRFNKQRYRDMVKQGVKQQIEHVFVVGLATDYCVRFTALDAIREGFRTTLIVDGCRGVELQPGDIERAIDEMKNAGVEMTFIKQVQGQNHEGQ